MKSWYRMIDVGMWGDKKFRSLSPPPPCGQFLWIYLLTGEHTEGLPGLYKIGEAALAEALGWEISDLRIAFTELQVLGMALMDNKARVIYLPNALKYQAPQNPKHLQGLGKAFRRIPECGLKDQWFQQIIEFGGFKGKPYQDAISVGFNFDTDTVSDRVSDTKTNTNTNTNTHSNTHKNCLDASSTDAGNTHPSSDDEIPFSKIVAHLNDRSGKRFRHGTDATRRHIRARWGEGHRWPDFERVIDAKCDEWCHPKMEKYLRPQTLFGPKFEGYANERSSGGEGNGSLYLEMDKLMELENES